jgi:FtsP/CotA-like multicopper oxidase with cupredoxin domain
MGEPYDLLVTLGDGAFPLVAVAEGKRGQGMAVVRAVVADLAAANPGRWLADCRNLYHSERGMMAVLDYRR